MCETDYSFVPGRKLFDAIEVHVSGLYFTGLCESL
jgi:hypothetical protein